MALSAPTFSPNPYGNFDPSQWANPYSQYQNQALPWPSSYVGWPTDAMGRPIQPTPGLTLNSAPQQQAAPQQAPQQALGQQGAQWSNYILNAMQGKPTGPAPAAASPGAVGAYGASGYDPANVANMVNFMQGLSTGMPQNTGAPGYGAGGAPQQAPQASNAFAAPSGGGGLDASSYLSLLANPGRVQTPGATVPQSANAYQPGSGVLQQFLQNWRPQQGGPGSGFQQGFYRALGGT